MKQCRRCGMQMPDTIEVCERCGGIEFITGNNAPRHQNGNGNGQPVRPQGMNTRPQGQPVRPQGMNARHQGQQPRPNMQGMSNGQGMQGVQGVQNGQGMPNQNGHFNQQARPNLTKPNNNGINQYGQSNGMNNQYGQNNGNNGMNNQFGQGMQGNQGYAPVNGTDAFGNEVNFDPNAGMQQPNKKSLFGKGKKVDKQPNQNNGFGDQTGNNGFENNGFGVNTSGQDFNSQAQQAMPGTFGVITVKRWLILWLQICIPIWGIIVIINTLKNPHEDPSIKNYIKAFLIMLGISVVLSIIMSVMLTSVIGGMFAILG